MSGKKVQVKKVATKNEIPVKGENIKVVAKQTKKVSPVQAENNKTVIKNETPVKEDVVAKQTKKVSPVQAENKKTIIGNEILVKEENKKGGNIKTTSETKNNSDEQPKKKMQPVKKLQENKLENKKDMSYLKMPENKIILELNDNDNNTKQKMKSDILKKIDMGHDILYHCENIEGEDALNDIMNLLFLKSIEPILSNTKEDGKIDLLNKEYYYDLYNDDILDKIFGYFKNISNIAHILEEEIRDLNNTIDLIRQIGDILITHPITGQIFTENNFIRAKKGNTIQELLNKVISKININELEQNEDVIGEIYEHIINSYVKKGSKLGQFFTPRKLMKLLLQYKEPRIKEIINGLNPEENIKLYDSCMGTGGWIVTGYNILKSEYKDRLLLSGGEIKQSTFQYGLMNLILTLNKFPHDVVCESSLTHINNSKHHIILTNPPFQTDKNFTQISTNFKSDKYTATNNIKLNDVYILKDNSPPIQFLELNLYKLEDNGLCIIVLPYGEMFFGASYQKNREYFMKFTNITDIVIFEGGIFTHTGIKTCAIIFEKNKTGTKEINFSMVNYECNKLTKMATVSIQDINKGQYKSWFLSDYLKDTYIENLSYQMQNYEWVEFGNVFTLEKGKLQSSKTNSCADGDVLYIIHSSKEENVRKIKSDTFYNGGLFISHVFNGNGGCSIRYTQEKCIHSNLMSMIIIKDEYKNKINLEFIYHYLKFIKKHIEIKYEKGSCNKSLDLKNFIKMKIPIPKLEEQEQIIINTKTLEYNFSNIIKGINSNKDMKLMYMENMVKSATQNNINKVMYLGDVIDIKAGTPLTESQFIDGNYNVIGGGYKYVGIHNKFNAPENTITIARVGSCGTVLTHKDKIFVTDSCFSVSKINTDIVTVKYIYNYLLLIEPIIKKYGKGSMQLSIKKNDILTKIKIQVPPLEYQKNMENVLDEFDNISEHLKKSLKKTKEHIKNALFNSLQDYGNPNECGIYKIASNI